MGFDYNPIAKALLPPSRGLSTSSVFPKNEFAHICACCFSRRYLAQLGLGKLGLPVPNNVTGRPGDRRSTTEMNGGSTASYLARTPRVPFYVYFHRSGSKGAFRPPGATWDRFCCPAEPSPGHIRCRNLAQQKVVSRLAQGETQSGQNHGLWHV